MSGWPLSSLAPSLLLAAAAVAPGAGQAAQLPGPALEVPAREPGSTRGEERVFRLSAPDEGAPGFVLTLPERTEPDLSVRPAGARLLVAAAAQKGGGAEAGQKAGAAGPMDFDLLGDAPKPMVGPEDASLHTRRRMLTWHQGLGIGLYATQVASTVTGQLNYSDKFGVANTGRYKATHRGLVYLNLAEFAVVGGIALFAPTEKNAPPRPFGRTTIHKIGMALATVGMITQGYLGIRTAQREGYQDKQTYGRAHLAVGYATLAAMSVAVGAIVF